MTRLAPVSREELIRRLRVLTYRHHPVTSIMRSAVPAANPDATEAFLAGAPTLA
jgi:hypothetical protein